MIRKSPCFMSLVKLWLDQGERLLGKLNPDTMVTFQNTNSEHHVSEMSGKNSHFFFGKWNPDSYVIYSSPEPSWSTTSLSQTLPTPLKTHHLGWERGLEQQSGHQGGLTSSFSSECKGNVYINLPPFVF